MGNASGKNDDEDEFMVPSPPPRRYFNSSLGYSSQIPALPLIRPAETFRAQNIASSHYLSDFNGAVREKLNPVMITWSYGGKQVAITGSWDNWHNREPLHKTGTDFVILKRLPSSVFHYRFIVDEHLTYAPDLPWESDESGMACNILDVQEDVPEAPESLSEFEAPSSPVSSYNCDTLNDFDFSREPPDMPPQLELTLLNDRSAMGSNQSLSRPRYTVLNHLYKIPNRDQPVALGSTHRFLHKYVTVVLYKP